MEHSIILAQESGRRAIGRIRQRLMWALLALSSLLLGALVVQLIGQPAVQPRMVDDYVEYWAAGRLNLQGGNPYGADELFALQRAVGWSEDQALMMWNPPWALALVMPFALLDYPLARLLWLFVNLVLLMVLASTLWRIYGGQAARSAHAGRRLMLVGVFFMPSLLALEIGQISLWITAGLVLFLVAVRYERWRLAGAALILVALKPHLAYLLWPALALWVWQGGRWREAVGIAQGAAATLLVTWGIPSLLNPAVTSQYLHAAQADPPTWLNITLGSQLRLLLGHEKSWLMFVPSAAGLLWLRLYWRRQGEAWSWTEQMPLLTLISFLTSSFGWPFDLVIVLPAVLQAAAWVYAHPSPRYRWTALAVYGVFNLFAIILYALEQPAVSFAWAPIVLLAGYLLLRPRTITMSPFAA